MDACIYVCYEAMKEVQPRWLYNTKKFFNKTQWGFSLKTAPLKQRRGLHWWGRVV